MRAATCFPPSLTSPPDRNDPSGDGPPRSVSSVLLRPYSTGGAGGALPGSSNTPVGFSATAGSGPWISFPSSSAVPGRTSESNVALPHLSGDALDEEDPATAPAATAAPSPTVLREPNPAAETSAAEYGTESVVESWRAEGALNTGPFRTDSSGGGSLAATEKPMPSHLRRRRRMMTVTNAARSRAPRMLPTTIPAMAPPLRLEEEEDESPLLPLPEPVKPELLGGIAMMFCWAPWFQVQAETLKTFRS